MPAAFSGRRLLLLLLLCTSLSGGSPADPAMTTQDSTQTQANSFTKMQAGLTESPGPDIATEELKPASKQDPASEYEIVIYRLRPTRLEKSVSLPRATTIELICTLDEDSRLKNPQVTWKKGSETISHTTKTPNRWSIEVTISDSSQLGSYSCILKGEVEIIATFHLQVPQIDGKEKPIITYEGDNGVMLCKTDHTPTSWTWYKANGTELVPIDASLQKEKYRIKKQSDHASRLKIFKLTKEDSGVYWCEAAFPLGNTKARFELKVLSIMEPLKPFLAVVAEVVILVTTIFLYESYSKRDENGAEEEREFHQIDQLRFTPTEVEIITKLQKMYAATHFKHSLCFEVKSSTFEK